MKAIRKMHPQIARRVMAAIAALAEDPRPSGATALKGHDAFRIRVADYRVVYTINDNELTVVVIRAGHRREIYRR
jgi:mRNA interferase RelE/StbE